MRIVKTRNLKSVLVPVVIPVMTNTPYKLLTIITTQTTGCWFCLQPISFEYKAAKGAV